MNILRRILLSLAIAVSFSVFSAQSFAGPVQDIDNVLKNIRAAEDAINGGAEGEEVYKMIKTALNSSKEINASDKISYEISKANKHLKEARKAAKKEELQVAEEHLKGAYKAFDALKGMIN